MTTRRRTDIIVVHCSATPPKQDIDAAFIRQWHRKERGWQDIGYHFVIKRDGTIEKGRDIHVVGAHVAGKNSESVGVCMVGGVDNKDRPENNFTPEQFTSLKKTLDFLKIIYPTARIAGHREFSNKACPSFDIHEWLKEQENPQQLKKGGMRPPEEEVITGWYPEDPMDLSDVERNAIVEDLKVMGGKPRQRTIAELKKAWEAGRKDVEYSDEEIQQYDEFLKQVEELVPPKKPKRTRRPMSERGPNAKKE